MKKIIIILLAFNLVSCKIAHVATQTVGESENGTCILVAGQYYTPEDFGAIGDGKHDDTDALRETLYHSNKEGKVVFIPSGKDYRIKGTLNFYNGQYQSYTLNLLGTLPLRKGSYSTGVNGGISVDNNVCVFANAQIGGSIERVCITGKRNESVHLFDNCTCSGLILHGCNVSNFGAIFYDTPINQMSEITYCCFLTAYYFSRNSRTSSGCTDSRIAFNYINGGQELKDNVCFEWGYFNGANVTDNFIDYYRTIYQPKANKTQAFVGPYSANNQYQVFRYLYYPGDNINLITFNSFCDSFNWVDPSSLDKLSEYKSIEYLGKDGNKYEIPPYIAICNSAWKTNIVGAKLERNIKDVVFVNSGLTEYKENFFNASFYSQYDIPNAINYRQGSDLPFYNNGKYMSNHMNISGLYESVKELPKTQVGWSKYPAGRKVLYNGEMLQSVNRNVNGKWVVEWEKIK